MNLTTYQREERGDFHGLARNRALLCQGAQDFSEVGHLVSYTVRRANTSVDVDLRVVRAYILHELVRFVTVTIYGLCIDRYQYGLFQT